MREATELNLKECEQIENVLETLEHNFIVEPNEKIDNRDNLFV